MTQTLKEKLTRAPVRSLLEFATKEHCFDSLPSERVRFSNIEDALCAMLDESVLAFCGDVRAYLATEQVFLSVTVFQRMTVSDSQRDCWTDGQIEWLRDGFQEEYADEEGDDRLSDEHAAELKVRMRSVIDWYIDHATVYCCDELRTWTFDSDDLLELVTALRPDWLTRRATTADGNT